MGPSRHTKQHDAIRREVISAPLLGRWIPLRTVATRKLKTFCAGNTATAKVFFKSGAFRNWSFVQVRPRAWRDKKERQRSLGGWIYHADWGRSSAAPVQTEIALGLNIEEDGFVRALQDDVPLESCGRMRRA